jgi:predicted MFS family arabinose efflux permease
MMMSKQAEENGLRAAFQRPYPVLAILFLIYMCNTMDRNIIAFLAEPIRKDLGLTDTQLGLLTGLAFAFFYTIFGVPIGWIADRVGRVLTISVACVVWSVCSMMGALSASFAHLAAARVGVAIGEAGGTAPSYALISAKFPPERRGAALGLFHVASPVSAFIGVALSAWVASNFGWRAALIAVSLPGLVAALLLFLLVREPARPEAVEGQPAPSLPGSFGDFLRHPVLRLCFIFAGLTSCTSHALISWLPSFMMRVKGMTLLEISAWYSVCFSISFGLGLWLGGVMGDRLSRRTPLAYAFVPAISLSIAIPFILMAVQAQSWQLSLALWAVPLCMSGTFLAPAIAVVQAYAPPHQATVFGSIYLLANNLVGAGLGPLYVGTVSDAFKAAHGTGALAYGMLALIPVILCAIGGQLLIARAISRNRTGGFTLSA